MLSTKIEYHQEIWNIRKKKQKNNKAISKHCRFFQNYIYIYISVLLSLNRGDSREFPESLMPSVPIFHRFWLVL